MAAYYLMTFGTTHAAMTVKRYLNGKVTFSIMPTLREITASCGISLRFEKQEDLEKAKITAEKYLSEKLYHTWQVQNGKPAPYTY